MLRSHAVDGSAIDASPHLHGTRAPLEALVAGRRRVQICTLRNGYLAGGAVLLVLYLLMPPFRGSPVVIASLSGSSALAIIVGVLRNRPPAPLPWLLFALAQALFFLGDIYTYVYPRLIGHEVPFPSIGDAIYLAQYPVLMLGVLMISRRRTPHGDRAGVVDALVLTLGTGLLSWLFLMAPYVHDATLGPLAKLVSIAYPLGDVLFLAAVLRLVFDGGRRSSSFYLLAGATAALLTTDAAYGYALLDGSFHHQLIYDTGWIGFSLLWGAAALDPTMRSVTEATPDRERRLTMRRLALLTIASVMAPAIEIVREMHNGDVDMLVIVAASIVLFLLVITRVVGLARQHERAVSRERVLGDAAVALVGAVSLAEVRVVALEAARGLVGDTAEIRICTETRGGLTLTAPDECEVALSAGTAAQIGAAIGMPEGGRLDGAARVELGVSPSAERVTVFPVVTPTQRGMLITASPGLLSPLIAHALRSLVASVSLARGAAAALEEAHRLEGEARFGSLVRNASDLITVVDLDGVIGYQSPSIGRILGYAAEDVVGQPFSRLLAAADRGRLAQVLAARIEGGAETHTFECLLAHADGRCVDFEVLATDLVDDEHVRGILLNGRDVSERKAFEAQIAHQAFHDAVTGLPNRALFSDRVQHALARVNREHESVGVIFLDLDDFKTVNDSLGHPVGDEVLREVGWRIGQAIRATDTAARFGGDEFAVLLEGVDGPEAVAGMADRIVAAFAAPVRLGAQEITVRPSLGIAVAVPEAGTPTISADDLVRNADAAMYICKRDGHGGYRVFEEAMHARVLERLILRGELEHAIEAGQFELYFQPLVDLRRGSPSGIEALCRWNHPTRGLVQPDQFIPLAEETGLIVELGRWVLQEGCRFAAGLQLEAPRDERLRLGVNLSVRQLQHASIVDDVRAALAASGLDPDALVLEVTESVMMADAELAATRLRELRALGARIAMDDFGTGYSSLSHLSRFPIDVLKMDRSFLSPDAKIDAKGLAAAIVSLGATLGLEVVAEGIERPDQMEALRELGCETGQGYLIGRPMSRDDTRRWLRERRVATSHLKLVA
jgi:diguanylate cyclase (GGDEF)-like protein/PAS domain S-box-containing protein